MEKTRYNVNGQVFTTGNGALAAIVAYDRTYDRKNPDNKFDRAKGHKILLEDYKERKV